ncbi:MAG: SDR family NAD(P)-dependent oxidoreductase [bacterium]|nr:SDR family NAD(P)-dependent oxidoreductase [bacterium]
MGFQKVLVTGVAGFIGSHTAKALLDRGEKVVGIDNMNDYYDVNLKKARLNRLESHPNFSFIKADIADQKAIEAVWDAHKDIDGVVHLAAQAGVRYSLENPFSYIHSNVTGHLVMMEVCRHRGGVKNFVYASSSSVYGLNKEMPFNAAERTDRPAALYGATKKMDELMSHSYSHLFRIPTIGLRFFTVYGPWGRPDMAAFIFANKILAGKPIQVFNEGNMRRDFTYVDDIVSGIIAALDNAPQDDGVNPPCKVYNLGNHKSEKLMDFIHTLEEALGRKAEMELLPMQPGDVPETYADIEMSQKELGFEPKTPISVGIPAFIDWYKEYHK